MKFAWAAVFITCAAIVWQFGGIRGDLLVYLSPPLSAMLLAVLAAGWKRTFARDPFPWVAFALIVLLALPFLNTETRWLPYCVKRSAHLNVFLWFVPTLLAALVTRLLVDDRGKTLLADSIVANGALLAIVGFVQLATAAKGPLWLPGVHFTSHFFATFGYPNMAGAYFTALLGLAGGVALAAQGTRRRLHFAAAVIFYAAAVCSLSRGAIMLATTLAVALILRAVFTGFAALSGPRRLTRVVLTSVFFALAALLVFLFTPKAVRKEFKGLTTDKISERLSGSGQYHVVTAMDMWKDHPWFGVGGWGYKYFSRPYAKRRGVEHIQKVGGINVHNDPAQFLAEHGVTGAALMLAALALLWWPLRRRLGEPFVFAMLAVSCALVIHSCGDSIFRSPSVLILFYLFPVLPLKTTN